MKEAGLRVRRMAQKARRPYVHLNRAIRKEKHASAIAARDGVTDGLICVFANVEASGSFKFLYGKGRPRLLEQLHVRSLIAKIPRSRRWRVTAETAALHRCQH